MFTSIDPLAEKYYGISPYAYCAGDPVNCVDKDGRWIQCLIGAGIGAAIDAGFEIYNQLETCDISDVNWGKVAVAAGKGALQGAISTSGVGLMADIAINVIGDVTVETVGQVVECTTGLRDEISTEEIGHTAVVAAASTLIGKGAEKAVKKLASTHYNSRSVVQQSKQNAKQELKKEGKSVSTAGDTQVKKRAKTERSKNEQRTIQYGNSGAQVVTQSGSNAAHREYDENKH